MSLQRDLLALEGRDIRKRPLLKRKAALQKLLKGAKRICYTAHVGEEGERFFDAAAKLGLEGIVAKRADSIYTRGRSHAWIKIKTERTERRRQS